LRSPGHPCEGRQQQEATGPVGGTTIQAHAALRGPQFAGAFERAVLSEGRPTARYSNRGNCVMRRMVQP
jgi:hypothetical protein